MPLHQGKLQRLAVPVLMNVGDGGEVDKAVAVHVDHAAAGFYHIIEPLEERAHRADRVAAMHIARAVYATAAMGLVCAAAQMMRAIEIHTVGVALVHDLFYTVDEDILIFRAVANHIITLEGDAPPAALALAIGVFEKDAIL